MKNRKKNKLNFKTMIISVICIIFLLIINSFVNKKINSSNMESNQNSINVITLEEQIKESENAIELEKLKSMSERNRIEYYIANFIKNIEEDNFDKAYEVLNKDFKKNYFSSLKDFTNYTKTKFTKMMNIEFTNFERNGTIYISWLTITDAINGSKGSGEELNFVVKENDFNDFELSFSVN